VFQSQGLKYLCSLFCLRRGTHCQAKCSNSWFHVVKSSAATLGVMKGSGRKRGLCSTFKVFCFGFFFLRPALALTTRWNGNNLLFSVLVLHNYHLLYIIWLSHSTVQLVFIMLGSSSIFAVIIRVSSLLFDLYWHIFHYNMKESIQFLYKSLRYSLFDLWARLQSQNQIYTTDSLARIPLFPS